MTGVVNFDDSQESFLKHSFQEDVSHYQLFSQPTDVKTRKAIFVGNDISRVLWLGYSNGRCVAQWKRVDLLGDDPFQETSRIALNSDPFDICSIGDEKYAVSLGNGDIVFINTYNEDIEEISRIKQIHGVGDARVVVSTEKKIISGSSSGSIIIVDAETGARDKLACDFTGVRSMCVLAGGSLLASGHSAGQLLVWDIRDPTSVSRPSAATPSKRRLDAVTAVASHPAQSNLLAFGTDNGAIGFCDVRGAGAELLPQSFELFTSSVTQIRFHPQCGEHMVCSSADGSIVQWDASQVNSGGFRSSTLSRTSVWTNENLGNAVQINMLRAKSFGGVYGFDVVAKSIVAAMDMMSITTFENVNFPISTV